MDDGFTKEQFTAIMQMAGKIEDIVDGNDFFIGVNALCVVLARGGRSALEKHRTEFDKEDMFELYESKTDYWWDFYDYLDEVEGEKQ